MRWAAGSFFVEEIPSTAAIPAANTTNVRPRTGDQDKITYEGQLNRLEGVVSNDYLHLLDVYLGECIATQTPSLSDPLDPLRAALPVHRPTMTMPVDHSECDGEKHNACQLEVETLHQSIRRRWNTADGMFRDAHKTQTIKDLYNNLNYRNKLTDQLEYLQSATKGGDAVRVS